MATTHHQHRLLAALWLLGSSGCMTGSVMAVNVPVCDLRAQPHTTAVANGHDDLEETQLVYGESVSVKQVVDGWAYVESIEQPEFSHHRRWEGYPGWLPESQLTTRADSPTIVVQQKWATVWDDAYGTARSRWRFALGTRLRATRRATQLWCVEMLDGSTVWLAYDAARSIGELAHLTVAEQRQAILRNAALLIGDSYYWGGRSPQPQTTQPGVTGVDCSGLINLAYRSLNVDLPRDAHEQFLRARRVDSLQPADLVFLSARGEPNRIVHAMLYAGEGELIEAPGTGQTVRRISAAQRLGRPIDQVRPGDVIDGHTVFFGAYLKERAASAKPAGSHHPVERAAPNDRMP